jgi:hypothetical protein
MRTRAVRRGSEGRARRRGKGASLDKVAVLALSGRAGKTGKKSDFFSRLLEYNRANQQGAAP